MGQLVPRVSAPGTASRTLQRALPLLATALPLREFSLWFPFHTETQKEALCPW